MQTIIDKEQINTEIETIKSCLDFYESNIKPEIDSITNNLVDLTNNENETSGQ